MKPSISFIRRKKPIYNTAVPVALADAFLEESKKQGTKRRWTTVTAAVLLFMEQSPKMQQAWVERLFRADLVPGEMEKLLAGARSRSKQAERAEKAAAKARKERIAAFKAGRAGPAAPAAPSAPSAPATQPAAPAGQTTV